MMGSRRISLLVVSLFLAAAGTRVRAATQLILGAKFDVRSPNAADPSKRSINVYGYERRGSPNYPVGDPTVDGGTLRVIARGPAAVYDETFVLPAIGWKATFKLHDWPVYKGFVFSNAATGGPVRSLSIKSSGWQSPEGTPPPEVPDPGQFRLKIRLLGHDAPFDVAPPNPGTDGGIVLTLGTGDTYCIAFGGSAGGAILANTPTRFAVKAPTVEGCPGE
jgi:hypothetical protein